MINKRKIASAFVIASIILAIIQVIFSTAFTTAGIDLSQLQYEKKAVEKENMLLGQVLYSKSSFTTIAKAAEDEGFAQQSAKSRISLSKTLDVAYVQ